MIWDRLALAVRILQVRLRFIVILALAFIIVGNWGLLRNLWDKLTRRSAPSTEAVSPETEYWCPMCPGVVSDWPGKCPVCNMSLVQRRRGEAVPLPDGVLARMQLSPYRMQLAGIQTSPVAYQALAYEMTAGGFLEFDSPSEAPIPGPRSGGEKARPLGVRIECFQKDLPFLKCGQRVEVTCPAEAGTEAHAAKVLRIGNRSSLRSSFFAWIELEKALTNLRPGMYVTVRARLPVSEIEPFRSMPCSPPPLRSDDLRAVFICSDHPSKLHGHAGRCPIDQKELEKRSLAANQRVGWWCPMHRGVTAERPGAECRECGGMKLVPRVITYRPPGQVLAIPEGALVDTGSKRVVYLDRGQGMFECVEVTVGPRCGDYYPVSAGLEEGQRVASAGALLIDAEARLNPGLAVGYFGATSSNRPPLEAAPQEMVSPFASALRELAPADRALVLEQKNCPVTGKPLGSMGTPYKVEVAGKTMFLCCEGCESRFRKAPAKYTSKSHD
jgi:YHS domain-containing protein